MKHVELPYTVEIDFVANPASRIHIESITPHDMPATTLSMTEANLRRYKEKKTESKDGPVLRLARLEHVYGMNYTCRLETSSYWMQSRTNLTIDLPLEHDSSKSLRTLDLDHEGNLKAFHDSMLVNSLGVCGVVYYVAKDSRRRYFMKRRKDSEGVFEDMIATTSGVVTFVPGQLPSELVAFAQHEMLREFMRETELYPDKVSRLTNRWLFRRELTRGGKPQFFFAIEMEELTEKAFQALFVKSPEGLEEFVDGVVAGRLDYGRSLSA